MLTATRPHPQDTLEKVVLVAMIVCVAITLLVILATQGSAPMPTENPATIDSVTARIVDAPSP